ncbi:MAG: hypothetical protein HQL84_06725 [Magnetococcales bacterium]|nr:hypothetical protein [Magnetococcales bacterium]MBF0149726.1 hypothetical protein [Magnetococcales bacterium]MBF0174533.1 hypothetical protein [Magnetococcales bacterium]MBF0347619.1 hypothetical protein [Magnetococcales bacterium]MBF0630714.1 hypothetical protein [Magnetococcales bacterium]
MSENTEQVLDQVLARVQGIWASPIPTSRFEFELKRLVRVVKEYRRREPTRAFYLLGLLATLLEDPQTMRASFKNALVHSGNDFDVRHGFGSCLARLGFFSESRNQYEILYHENPEDLDVLAELIVSSLAAGRIQEGVKWIQCWSELNPDRPFEEAETIAKSGALLEKFGISDDQVERLQGLALKILEKERKEVKTINYRGMPEENPQWIDASLVLDEPADVVEELNSKLASALSSTATPRKVADLVVFNYAREHQSVS